MDCCPVPVIHPKTGSTAIRMLPFNDSTVWTDVLTCHPDNFSWLMEGWPKWGWRWTGVTFIALSEERQEVLVKQIRLASATTTLQTLWLSRCKLSAAMWSCVLEMIPTLKTLTLDESQWNPSSDGSLVGDLCNALKRTTSLREFSIQGCGLAANEMSQLVSVLITENASIRDYLNFSKNFYNSAMGSLSEAQEIRDLNRKAQVLCERSVMTLLPLKRYSAIFPREVLRMIGNCVAFSMSAVILTIVPSS